MDNLSIGMFIRLDMLKEHGDLITNENLGKNHPKSTERQAFEKELEEKLLREGKNTN